MLLPRPPWPQSPFSSRGVRWVMTWECFSPLFGISTLRSPLPRIPVQGQITTPLCSSPSIRIPLLIFQQTKSHPAERLPSTLTSGPCSAHSSLSSQARAESFLCLPVESIWSIHCHETLKMERDHRQLQQKNHG